MQKIVSLFQRNYDGDRLVRDEVVPGAEWVLAGEGTPTVKYDGTCCLVRDGKLYKRYDVKKGRTPPADFEAAQDPDPVTGHHPGWVPVGDGPEDKWHREAFESYHGAAPNGTYELVGPKVQGNPYGLKIHVLNPHGSTKIEWFEARDFKSIRSFLEKSPSVEGIVWHHPDGRMVKVKRRDFGFSWPPKAT